jgi:hypothetical protein
MKTLKGNTYRSLLDIKLTDRSITLNFPTMLPVALLNINPDTLMEVADGISERIQKGIKPAATLEKIVGLIETHRVGLIVNYVELFRCYNYMTTPQLRPNVIDKTRQTMLESITDMKALRTICTMTLGEKADAYILPDFKDRLIAATIAAMKQADL